MYHALKRSAKTLLLRFHAISTPIYVIVYRGQTHCTVPAIVNAMIEAFKPILWHCFVFNTENSILFFISQHFLRDIYGDKSMLMRYWINHTEIIEIGLTEYNISEYNPVLDLATKVVKEDL